MPTININDEMGQAAEYAIKIGRECFGKQLNYSENNLPTLEYIIEQAHQQFDANKVEGKITNDTALNRTASIWGSYLGELIRAKLGGTWTIEESKRLMVINSQKFSPIEFVYQRITGRLNINVLTYYGDVSNKIFLQQINPIKSTQPEQVIRRTTQHTFKKDNKSKSLLIGILSVGSILLVISFISLLNGGNLSSTQASTFKPSPTPNLILGNSINYLPVQSELPPGFQSMDDESGPTDIEGGNYYQLTYTNPGYLLQQRELNVFYTAVVFDTINLAMNAYPKLCDPNTYPGITIPENYSVAEFTNVNDVALLYGKDTTDLGTYAINYTLVFRYQNFISSIIVSGPVNSFGDVSTAQMHKLLKKAVIYYSSFVINKLPVHPIFNVPQPPFR
jgi:hypothetical protein